MRSNIAPRWRRAAFAGALTCLNAAVGFAQSAGSWTGPFVGAELAGSLDTVSTAETTAATGAVFHRFDSSGGGVGGGVDLGYNWQPWGDTWLLGGIATLDFPSNSAGRVIRTGDDVIGELAVRAGYLPSAQFLWYAQTGLALASESVRVDFGGPVSCQSRTAAGYALGGGAEWAPPAQIVPVAGTSLFVDYQHIWWDTGALTMPAAVPGLNLRWQRDANLVKAGLRVRF